MKTSFETEKEFRSKEVAKLRREHKRLQDRLDQTYVDKIDGRISTEFWRKTHDRWVTEQNRISNRIDEVTQANRNYYEQGVEFLELAQAAQSLYLSMSMQNKGQLLRKILSNCIIKKGTLCPTYSNPFDLIANMPPEKIKLGDRDSNPDTTVQSRMSYHWTIAQCTCCTFRF